MLKCNSVRVVLIAAGALLFAMGCRPSGYSFVETDKINTVDDLSTLMWVQADSADPRFDIADDLEDAPSKMTDAQAREFIDLGQRLQASSKRLLHFTQGEKFTSWANGMGAQAAALEKAARAGNGAEAVKQTFAIRTSCRSCHSEYR